MLRGKLIRRFDSRYDRSTGPVSTLPPPSTERPASKERNVPRFEARLVASVEVDDSSYVGFIENVSQDGVFVATQAPPRVGAAVSLLIALPDLALVRAQGTVRWVRQPSNSDRAPAGMGIRFERLSALDAVRIYDFLRARQSSILDDGEGMRLRSA
jgi:uncharacterized protein (TIGR02266 family)